MKNIHFIHCADLHLDSPFLGLQHLPKELFKRIQESTFRSFENIVNEAIERKVDFLLISGDLYDGEDRSIKAQARFRKQMERLYEVHIPVYMIHGNHDHLSGQWITIEMPDNVHLFSSQVESKLFQKGDTTVKLYGFSYEERHIWEKKIQYYQKQEEADFHIGLLHGSMEGGETAHQPYSPFTIHELVSKGFDYWALGHIHQQQVIHKDPFIVYPGNIQGRYRKERGQKGCYEISLSEYGAELNFIETCDIVWEKVKISLTSDQTFHSFFIQCEEIMNQYRKSHQGVLLEIVLENVQDQEILKKILSDEMIELLTDGEEHEDSFVWVYQIQIQSQQKLENFYHPFFNEFERQLESLTADDWEEALSLYFHPKARRFLSPLTVEEKIHFLEESKNYIGMEVQKGGKHS
ncbi:DNA repair exonuclease SbcCD nuclease subunit [Oikeobacillus pervagus]|uniref:DNA repair exonuclease SbcCD nuclease subunit n=1 Tax=Oikeobacillus pervagus TaxID=1325931 RepID=A0AAJ1T0V1_9BACI|nr:DNA repair exonuclease [Oikeobacillus pervagus]MDQ0214747.1 DNA repair exonuclease SbcCD nuclease subunit [Oikeobacillus pervagus]